MGITQIRTQIIKMKDYKNYEAYFTSLKRFEDLVTNALFFIDRRKGMRPEDYNDDINTRLIELINFKDTGLSSPKIFLLRILRANDTGDLPLYQQHASKDKLLPHTTNRGNRLQMLSAKVAAQQQAQQQAHIEPAVLRKDIGRYRKAQAAQAAQEAAEAGISPRPRQSAKASAGIRPASGAPRNRGFVPSETPLPPPPPYSTLYRRTSAAASAASAASNKLPQTIIAQPPVYRPPIILGEETLRGYERGVYPSLLSKNVVAVDKLQISPPVLSTRRGSHSFKSNSPDDREEVVIDIEGDVRNPPEVYLIDNKDDGLCFLNAIFDYLLYSGKLPTMYERLLAIEKLILKQDKYKNDIFYIQQIRDVAFKKIGITKEYDPLEELLIETAIGKDSVLDDKKEQGQLIRLTGIQKDSSHPEYEDYTQLYYTDTANKVIHLGHPKGVHKKPIYEEQRINFAKSMKYMVALYILSYGKRKFIENIRLVLITERTERGETAFPNDWNNDLRTKFEIGNISDNLDDFVYQYVFEYMSKDTFFANEILMSMFNKILFKKIKDANGKNIPRFWLEVAKAKTGHGRKGIIPTEDKYLNLREDRKFTRVLNKYRFKTSVADAPLNKYIHTDYKYDNYISLLCDEDRLHFLLFLLEEELKYELVDKPIPKRGGRPKTATKPKRPKTATKPKRPKTAK